MAFSDIVGNIQGFFQLGIGGNRLKNTNAGVAIRNASDTADAQFTTAQLNNSGNGIVLNSAATQAGSSWLYNLARPIAGMTANMTLVLPASPPVAGQALVATDNIGTLAFQNIVLDRPEDKVYALNYNTSSPVTLFALPVGAIVKNVTVFVDTPFSGFTAGSPPTVSIGTTSNNSLLMATNQNDLTDAATAKSYIVNPSIPTFSSAQNLIATYVANGATAGAARILIEFSTPSNP